MITRKRPKYMKYPEVLRPTSDLEPGHLVLAFDLSLLQCCHHIWSGHVLCDNIIRADLLRNCPFLLENSILLFLGQTTEDGTLFSTTTDRCTWEF